MAWRTAGWNYMAHCRQARRYGRALEPGGVQWVVGKSPGVPMPAAWLAAWLFQIPVKYPVHLFNY
jgi:hypothetical protein